MIYKGAVDVELDKNFYKAETLDRIDEHFLRLIDKKIISSATYALSHKGEVFAHRSMGIKSDADGNKSDFTPDTLRRVFSITKVFTATAILKLMQDGKISPETEVCSILPEFNNDMHKGINLVHLLTHTSGLAGDSGQNFEPYPYEDYEAIFNSDNWIKTALRGPMAAPTGSRWIYCTKGYWFLAEIVSRISGISYDEYVTKNILEPLGMSSTAFFPDKKLLSRIAFISDWDIEDARSGKSNPVAIPLGGGGGLYSTVTDLQRLAAMWLNNGSYKGKAILSRKIVECACRAQAKDVKSTSWQSDMFNKVYKRSHGLGWEIGRHIFMSPGSLSHEGFQGSGMFIDPKEEFIFTGFYAGDEFNAESWVNPLIMAWSGIL